jgi:hypothetical protein
MRRFNRAANRQPAPLRFQGNVQRDCGGRIRFPRSTSNHHRNETLSIPSTDALAARAPPSTTAASSPELRAARLRPTAQRPPPPQTLALTTTLRCVEPSVRSNPRQRKTHYVEPRTDTSVLPNPDVAQYGAVLEVQKARRDREAHALRRATRELSILQYGSGRWAGSRNL